MKSSKIHNGLLAYRGKTCTYRTCAVTCNVDNARSERWTYARPHGDRRHNSSVPSIPQEVILESEERTEYV